MCFLCCLCLSHVFGCFNVNEAYIGSLSSLVLCHYVKVAAGCWLNRWQNWQLSCFELWFASQILLFNCVLDVFIFTSQYATVNLIHFSLWCYMFLLKLINYLIIKRIHPIGCSGFWPCFFMYYWLILQTLLLWILWVVVFCFLLYRYVVLLLQVMNFLLTLRPILCIVSIIAYVKFCY